MERLTWMSDAAVTNLYQIENATNHDRLLTDQINQKPVFSKIAASKCPIAAKFKIANHCQATIKMDNSLHFTSVKHADQVIMSVNRLRKKLKFCDIFLIVEDIKIPAHRVVLSACFPFFENLLDQVNSSMQREINLHLKGLDPDAVTSIVDFCYTSTISVTEENVWHLLPVANRLQVEEVLDVCWDFLHSLLCNDTCVRTWAIAHRLKADALQTDCLHLIQENFTKLIADDFSSLVSLSCKELCDLISAIDSDFVPLDEQQEAIEQWIEKSDKKKLDSGKMLYQNLPDFREMLEVVFPNRDQDSANALNAMDSSDLIHCTLCMLLFDSKDRLQAHMTSHGDGSCVCMICGDGYPSTDTLVEHIKSHVDAPSAVSNGNSPVANGNYDTAYDYQKSDEFASGSNLISYLASTVGNENKKGEKCPICQRVFKSKCNLSQHMQVHNPKKEGCYPCAKCSKILPSIRALEIHARTHSGVKPFTCEECGTSFGHKVHLRRHMNKHLGNKPFTCPICDKKFYRNDHLKRHFVSIHSKEVLSCEICGKEFKRNYDYKKHKQQHLMENVDWSADGNRLSSLANGIDDVPLEGQVVNE